MINETIIDCELELAEEMYDAFMDFDSVACISNYYKIKELLSALIIISDGEFKLNEIDLHEDMDEEYLLVLDDMGLWVYYMEVNGRYMPYDHDVVFIDNTCNSRVLAANENEECEIIFFTREDEIELSDYECNGDCATCEYAEESDGDMKGFTFNFSNEKGNSTYSFYSSDYEMVEKMRQEMSKMFK